MASDKPRFLVSRTYQITTPESAEHGNFAEDGFIFQDETMSLEEAVRNLRDCCYLSSAPIRSLDDLTRREWASTEPVPDYSNGNDQTDSVHIRRLNGDVLSPEQLYRLFKLSGLI
jgi:hypothetical protein